MCGDGGSSDVILGEMNSLLYSSTFTHPFDGDFAKIKELISSDADAYSNYYDHGDSRSHSRNQNQNQNQQQQHDGGGQNESSLTRYRSAPSSFFANLLNENGCDDFLEPVDKSSNHEPEESFFSGDQQQQQKFESNSSEFLQYASSPTAIDQQLDLPPVSTAMYGGSSQRLPNLSPINNHINHKTLKSSSAFTVMNSTSSNLIRQSSSPAGFLSSLNAENGFSSIRDVGKVTSSSRLSNRIYFSPESSPSPISLPQFVKNTNEMNDSAVSSLKRTRNGDLKMLPSSIALDTQNGASGHHSPGLVHHMSLPKTSSEMAVVEKFLRFDQDRVPCKLRAKRGHATHPRSIAERVRRTRISERIKKLQELFPNIDKQTSTADMLDLAVEYIKDIQKTLQTLKDARARCTCSSKQLRPGSTS